MPFPVVAIRQPNRAVVYLSVRGPIEIGRECDGFLLADAQASRRHLLLDQSEGRAVVTDLGSTNGTLLNGQTISATVALVAGSVVSVGNTTLELVEDVRDTAMPGDPPSAPAARTTMVGADESTGWTKAEVPADLRRTSIDLVATSVAQSGLDLRPFSNDQGTVTIVFSDIESSTERNMALGDQEWFEVLSEHNEIVRRLVSAHHGAEVKNQGDGFMLSFPGARMALSCMMEVQRQLSERAALDSDRAVRIRVGLHTGEVLVDDDGDLFGKHVVVAARVANLAAGGEILVSSLVKEITSARGDVVFGEPRQVELKGIGGTHEVYPVDWSVSLAD